MSNFAQFVFTLPANENDPIKAVLSKNWDQLKGDQRTLTQPQVRRALGIPHTPSRITIQPSNPGYATLIGLAQTSPEHVEKFETQKARAKENKANAKFIQNLRETFGLVF